jgi:leucyl aminopeptidase
MKLRKLSSLVISSIALTSFALQANVETTPDKKVFITVGSDVVKFSEKKFGSRVETIQTVDGISLLSIDESALPWLSLFMHKEFKRCGGFIRHDSESDADLHLNSVNEKLFAKNNLFINYKINQEEIVKPMLDNLRTDNLLATITKLSSFKNRYYKGETGKQSAAWIKDLWSTMVKGRSDASVEYFKHSAWDQPSVILTIKGKSDETIILGGHQDSINGWGGATAKAPGADDNASGIATITEVIRVLMESSYQPQKTIKFMAYAAEEVGLLGSNEIAKDFKSKNINVVGVMQLDMTNFKGSKDLDIVMMKDYTNDEQNQFIGSIIDHYVPGIKWGFDECGYACSDHASWHMQGFPASMPFESKMHEYNSNIHTPRDLLSVSENHADHAIKFAKMATAYIVELDR